MTGPVVCLKPNCGREWPRDPALEVQCPECRAPIGSPCKRPSGHPVFARGVHGRRDLLADAEGHYGTCPSHRCGQARKKTEGIQSDLFAET